MSKIITLKAWQQYFEPMLSGIKKFDYRGDADRLFQEGDTVVFEEVTDRARCIPTGRTLTALITYVYRTNDNMAILSLEFIAKEIG